MAEDEKYCPYSPNQKHEYEVIDTKENKRWAEQGGAEFEWTETITVSKCKYCSCTIESSSGFSGPDQVFDSRYWKG